MTTEVNIDEVVEELESIQRMKPVTLGQEVAASLAVILLKPQGDKKPSEKQLEAASNAHYEFSAKWRTVDYPGRGRDPFGVYMIQEDPRWCGPTHIGNVPPESQVGYRFNTKEERDDRLRFMMLEAITEAVINA